MKQKTTVILYLAFIIAWLYGHLTLFVVLSWLNHRGADQENLAILPAEEIQTAEKQTPGDLVVTEPIPDGVQDLAEQPADETSSEIQLPENMKAAEKAVAEIDPAAETDITLAKDSTENEELSEPVIAEAESSEPMIPTAESSELTIPTAESSELTIPTAESSDVEETVVKENTEEKITPPTAPAATNAVSKITSAPKSEEQLLKTVADNLQKSVSTNTLTQATNPIFTNKTEIAAITPVQPEPENEKSTEPDDAIFFIE